MKEIVQQFIELRSDGISFARLAAQLGVPKSALINWSREHQHLIQPGSFDLNTEN